MPYDYSKLKGRIIEKCGTLGEFAKRMSLSDKTIGLKLDQLRPFTAKDIEKAVAVLDLDRSEINLYFFTLKVQ